MYFPLLIPHSWGKRSAAQPKTVYSEIPQFSIPNFVTLRKHGHFSLG